MFITDEDYDVQTRNEIIKLLDNTDTRTALRLAERMAMDQIKKLISKKYDMAAIFAKVGENRDAYIVMIVIDIALYHIWAGRAPRMIPEYRNTRYRDAINWLTDVANGMDTDLPLLPQDTYKAQARIFSLYAPNDNKY